MTTSISFTTPMASFSTTDFAINRNEDSGNQESFHSAATSAPKRHPTTTSLNLQPITTDNTRVYQNDSFDDEDDHLLSSHYDNKRLKQEKLLLITNIFRILVICVFAPLIYFLA